MPDQPSLFFVPPVAVTPVARAIDPPIAGKTDQARHASWTGARAVVETWPERQSVVLQLLAGGAKCRQELAGLTPYGINGICSVVAALLLKGAIEPTGDFDQATWASGLTTSRERLQIRRT